VFLNKRERMSTLLELRDINKHFGSTYAVRNVSFDVEKGEVCALVGENGAGKSTLGKLIGGIYPPDSGEFIFEGNHLFPKTPLEAQKWGISIVHQELDLFPSLSVAMNIMINNMAFGSFCKGFVNPAGAGKLAQPYLDAVHLSVDPLTLVEDLSMAQMQLVYIARCLSMDSKLIVMDEPTSSLTDDAVENLFLLIEELREKGTTILYVSHKMSEIYRIADSIVILRDGAFVRKTPVKEITPQEVIKDMVGRELSRQTDFVSHATDEVLLQADHLSNKKLKDISFALHKGEVLGIAGLVGAGRSELGETLFGVMEKESGSVSVKGKETDIRRPRAAIEEGIGLVPEDRKLQGLMMDLTVKENAALSNLFRMNDHGFLDRTAIEQQTRKVMDQTSIKAASPEIEISSLSGGNQQKVLIARWLMVDPEILFLDDPTRGIDVGAKHDIYQIIKDLSIQGKGILFVSSELPELLRCCDTILVMAEGRISGVLDARKTTQEEIMAYASKEY
jgi:ABC-type sugar transport system ATPase subunit